ncbi:hypothetical protein [Hymenobacter ruber]
MTRSRSTSRVGSLSLLQPAGCPRKGSRPLLLLLLLGLLSGSPAAWAQPPANAPAPRVAADSASAPAVQPASHWSTVWAVLGGVAIGALGVWLFVRKPQIVENQVIVPETPSPKPTPAPTPAPEPVRKKPAENVRKSPPAEPPAAESTGKGVSFQSMREVQGTIPKQPPKPPGKDKRNQPNFNSRNAPAANSAKGWPPIAPRPSAMNPTSPTPPPTGDNQPLEPGQTMEWAAPTSTPPAIQELIDSSANEAAAAEAAPETATPAASNGPLHYYAPAPDVPSIEHRKLSPNPLPQMPLLITLPSAEAVTAQFSFSPQADQSRIIGNGVRELKEFFQFELPPTEQFTTIKNLKAGKLEKRDDAWHVVQKAEIALS